MKHLDLFSGIGGFALAAKSCGFATVQFVEKDDFCKRVLGKNFPGVPIHGDITTFSAIEGQQVDVITAGFPCQDISQANSTKARQGLEGSRSGLFFEIIRLVRQIRPRYLVLENSAALLNFRKGRDMGAILWELSQCGYDAEWSVVSGCSVGAPHMRKRLFIVAYPNRQHGEKRMAIQLNNNRHLQAINKESSFSVWTKSAPQPGGISNGIPNRMDRVRALGNAVIPAVAEVALKKVLQLEAAA
ncbi:MAG: DNA (cytosine-5-)-methyltransferase [Cyanobacteria bacterium P01_F01_bin.86]